MRWKMKKKIIVLFLCSFDFYVGFDNKFLHVMLLAKKEKIINALEEWSTERS